jgi:hypothetical protein
MATTQYVVEFEAKAFGSRCHIEVAVDVATRQTEVRVAFASSKIGLESLRELRDGIDELRRRAALIDSLPANASTHRLRCSVAGASAELMHDDRHRAWYAITIGDVEQNGLVTDYDASPLNDLISTAQSYLSETLDKLARQAAR